MSTPTQRLSLEATDDRAEILFYEALKQPLGTRGAFLERECGEDTKLRAEIEELLHDHERAGGFLKVDAPLSNELSEEFARLKPEEIGDRIGPYKLLELIGEGGFGRIWVAEQERPIRRRVALKIIKLGMDTKDVIARFEQERQALALMDHPNIAKVHDAGATPLGRPFFVMELVRGIKITEYCDRAELPTESRLKLFIQVCAAVQHAHQKGIIHRDLKPSNILIGLHDGVPVPKVIDFGVAKATQQQRLTDLTVYTQFEQMIGTPLYMSPEQAELSALDVDTRSDIYSLGVLLYELLTGRTPFDPERLMKTGIDEMRRIIREEEPQKPSAFLGTMAIEVKTKVAKHRDSDVAKLFSTIRGDLDWIVMKALEKDRNRRYETATGLATDVHHFLANEPIQARPPGSSYRFRRWVRRNKVVFSAGATVILVLMLGATVSFWQGFRARKEANRANNALTTLHASAPAFASMATTFVDKGQFEEAIKQLDIAIQLQPKTSDFLLKKANLLECQLRFAEAEQCYRAALESNFSIDRSLAHARVCKTLSREFQREGKASRETLLELYALMREEQRSPNELLPISRLLGEENTVLLPAWKARLKNLPVGPERTLDERLTVNELGELQLDLSRTEVDDLSSLVGMPLSHLDLTLSDRISEISPLRGLPLRSLNLSHTEVLDLSPLADCRRLRILSLAKTKIRDLAALRELALEELDLTATLINNISDLQGMPLRKLWIASTSVSDLHPIAGATIEELNMEGTNVVSISPLSGMPLERFDCSRTKTADFSPISNAKLRHFSAEDTGIGDIAFLSKMPLEFVKISWSLDVSNIRSLASIQTLRELILPGLWMLSDDELAAVEGLRAHANLTSIIEGAGAHGKSADEFWKLYDVYSNRRSLVAQAASMIRGQKHAEAVSMLEQAADGQPDAGLFWGLGALYLAKGDLKKYQTTCNLMVGRFRRRLAGDEVAVRLCVLGADAAVPLSEIRRLMPHTALAKKSGPYYHWYSLTNGLLKYREGRYLEAMDLLRETETNRCDAAMSLASSGLSMAYAKLGDLQSAQSHLNHARALIQGVWASEHKHSKSLLDAVGADALLQEAEQVIATIKNGSKEDYRTTPPGL